MATSPNYLYTYISIILLISTSIIHVTSITPIHNGTSTTIRKGLTMELIHRFSPCLSFHQVDNFEKFFERNEKQVMHQHTTSFQEGVQVNFITPTPDHLFFINLSIGEPPIPQYLAMDIDSSLTWVVGGSLKKNYKYSSKDSSTYNNFSCDSRTCKRLFGSVCDEDENSVWPMRYGEGQISDVEVGTDQLAFNYATVMKGVPMGINFRPTGKLYTQVDFYGIFGLGPKYPSFIHWLNDLGANEFSYYIDGLVTENIHPNAKLVLGGLGDARGDNGTPLRLDDTRYLLSLQSLNLGVTKLDIEPSVFAFKNKVNTGVTISTTALNTYLADTAYSKLFAEVSDLLTEKHFDVKNTDPNDLCFYGSLEELERSDFPALSFNFAEGATLKLDEDDLFIRSGVNFYCMTVKRSSTLSSDFRRLTVIGLTAQQDYIMGFDLENSRLYMKLP